MPTFFILDEFANIGQIPDFDQKISTSRSRKIQFSVILQNLDQLEAIYEKSFETIIGNCDTQIFLGSNSQKTVEYFSKALGNKTISRESISVSKDKGYHKQGSNYSDNIMERALMTPDELRRFDVNSCIIFESGIRPIKAKKYYYFKNPEGKKLAMYHASHNEARDTGRGEWRKYNPYNPYVEESKDEPKKDLKVESLDDLFEEDNTPPQKLDIKTPKAVVSPMLPLDDFIEEPVPSKEVPVKKEVDIQKELEAKFDELFGPLDDND